MCIKHMYEFVNILMKTLKQNKDLKSITACFAKNGSSGGICEVIKKRKK